MLAALRRELPALGGGRRSTPSPAMSLRKKRIVANRSRVLDSERTRPTLQRTLRDLLGKYDRHDPLTRPADWHHQRQYESARRSLSAWHRTVAVRRERLGCPRLSRPLQQHCH